MNIVLEDFYPPAREFRILGRLTRMTTTTIRAITLVLSLVGIPLVLVFTLAGGMLAAIPGVALLYWTVVETGFWLLAAFLRLTSKAWQSAPAARILLLPAGLIVAPLGYLLTILVAGATVGVKYRKLVFGAACDSWPLADRALAQGEAAKYKVAEDWTSGLPGNVHWQ